MECPVILTYSAVSEMKGDYGTNGNNGRSAGFQRADFDDVPCPEAKHAGSLRTGRYFRLFRNLPSFHYQKNTLAQANFICLSSSLNLSSPEFRRAFWSC